MLISYFLFFLFKFLVFGMFCHNVPMSQRHIKVLPIVQQQVEVGRL